MGKFVAGVPFIEICKNSGEKMCFNAATKYKHNENTITFESFRYEPDFFENLCFDKMVTVQIRFKEFECDDENYVDGKPVGDKIEVYRIVETRGPIVSNCNLGSRSFCTYILKTDED